MRRRKEVGVRQKADCYQVYARVQGVFRQVPGGLPLTSTPGERAAARERLIEQWGGKQEKAATGSFAADVVAFLAKPEIAALATVATYARYLALWVEALGGDRTRASITRDDIETVIQLWLKTLKPATVYHRRTALGRLYTILDGEAAPNPVRATTCPDHYQPEDKSIPYETVVAILAAMPTERFVKKGIRQPSLARLVAVTIAATGIPAAELLKLHRRDFEPARNSVRMPWRDKGAGTPAHRRELMSPGVAALTDLFAAACNAQGRITFGTPGVTHSFKRAARRVCGPDTPISVYWLRHTFGADTYRLTRDLDTVRRLLGHVEGSVVTSRYALGAHAEVDRAALAAMETARATATPAPDVKLPVKLPKRRKLLTEKGLARVS